MTKFSTEKHLIAREQLGEFIRDRRIEMGRSVYETASFIGISMNTLERIEQGKFNFDIMLLFKVCEALEIKPYFVPLEHSNDFEDD